MTAPRHVAVADPLFSAMSHLSNRTSWLLSEANALASPGVSAPRQTDAADAASSRLSASRYESSTVPIDARAAASGSARPIAGVGVGVAGVSLAGSGRGAGTTGSGAGVVGGASRGVASLGAGSGGTGAAARPRAAGSPGSVLAAVVASAVSRERTADPSPDGRDGDTAVGPGLRTDAAVAGGVAGPDGTGDDFPGVADMGGAGAAGGVTGAVSGARAAPDDAGLSGAGGAGETAGFAGAPEGGAAAGEPGVLVDGGAAGAFSATRDDGVSLSGARCWTTTMTSAMPAPNASSAPSAIGHRRAGEASVSSVSSGRLASPVGPPGSLSVSPAGPSSGDSGMNESSARRSAVDRLERGGGTSRRAVSTCAARSSSERGGRVSCAGPRSRLESSSIHSSRGSFHSRSRGVASGPLSFRSRGVFIAGRAQQSSSLPEGRRKSSQTPTPGAPAWPASRVLTRCQSASQPIRRGQLQHGAAIQQLYAASDEPDGGMTRRGRVDRCGIIATRE